MRFTFVGFRAVKIPAHPADEVPRIAELWRLPGTSLLLPATVTLAKKHAAIILVAGQLNPVAQFDDVHVISYCTRRANAVVWRCVGVLRPRCKVE